MAYGWYGELSVDKPLHQKQHCSVVKRKSTRAMCTKHTVWEYSFIWVYFSPLPPRRGDFDCATWLLSQDRFDKAIIDEGTNFSHPRYIFRLLKATARHLAQHSQIDIFGGTRVLGLLQSKAKSNWSNWKQNKGGFRSYFLGHFFFFAYRIYSIKRPASN